MFHDPAFALFAICLSAAVFGLVWLVFQMFDDRIAVAVSFQPHVGYVARTPTMTVNALSLELLRQRCATSLGVSAERVQLKLDRSARRERDARRRAEPITG